MNSTKIKLSASWTAIMFNIAFADIVGFIHPGTLEKIIDGSFGVPVTPELLLVFSIFLEIPIAMIFLCLVLPDKTSRWLNTFAVTLTILFVVGGGSATYSYFFFAAIEITGMLAVMWLVWKRLEQRNRQQR
ncbi:MAG: DUF6326 family protein [Phormidesmis sp.]